MKTEVDKLKNRRRELQLNRQIMSTAAANVKVPLHVCKLQFEKISSTNNWIVEDKVAPLFVA